MNKYINFSAVACLFLIMQLAFSDTLQPINSEQVMVAKYIKAKPYEVSSGTIIPLTIQNIDDIFITAVVTYNVYDSYENVVIPTGSRLLGKRIKVVNNRTMVLWDVLQTFSPYQTITFNHPLIADMPDGSSGILNIQPGSRAITMIEDKLSIAQ